MVDYYNGGKGTAYVPRYSEIDPDELFSKALSAIMTMRDQRANVNRPSFDDILAKTPELKSAGPVGASSRTGGSLTTSEMLALSEFTRADNDRLFKENAKKAAATVKKPDPKGYSLDEFGDDLASTWKGTQTLAANAQKKHPTIAKAIKAAASPTKDFLEKAIDILSRPLYGTAAAYKSNVKQDLADDGKISGWERLGYLAPFLDNPESLGENLKAYGRGIAGKEKDTMSDVLKLSNPNMGRKTRAVLGFGLDIALDPTSYLPLGAVKTAGRAIGKGSALAAHAKANPTKVKLEGADAESFNKIVDKYGLSLEDVVDTNTGTRIPSTRAELDERVSRTLVPKGSTNQVIGTAIPRTMHIKDTVKFTTHARRTVYETAQRQHYATAIQAAKDSGAIVPIVMPTKVTHHVTARIDDHKAFNNLLERRGQVDSQMAVLNKADPTLNAAKIASLKQEQLAISKELKTKYSMRDIGDGVTDDPRWMELSLRAHSTDEYKAVQREYSKAAQRVKRAKTPVGKANAEKHFEEVRVERNNVFAEQMDFFDGPLGPNSTGTTRLRVLKVEEHVPGMTRAEASAARRANNTLARSLRTQASELAGREADEVSVALAEIMMRESAKPIKRFIEFKLGLPFTKANTPNTAIPLMHIALPDVASKALAKVAQVPIVENSIKHFDKVFRSSAGSDPILNAARLSAAGQADRHIQYHTGRLRTAFEGFKEEDRIAALRQYLRYDNGVAPVGGLHGEIVAIIDRELHSIAEAFKQPINELGERISVTEYEKWLPPKFRFEKLDTAHGLERGSVEWLRASLNHAQTVDPAELLWHMTVAKEQITARLSLKSTVIHNYAIKKSSIHESDRHTIRMLEEKFGHRTVKQLGDDNLFAKEVADDLEKMFTMVESARDIDTVSKFYDRVMSIWKLNVTVNNPGYHMRNSIGDAFVGYLHGVSGAQGLKAYKASGKIMRAMRQLDEANPVQQAVLSNDPTAAARNMVDIMPNTPVLKTKHGQTVTAEEIWILYNKFGLPSGFTSTEFQRNFRKSRTGVLKTASAVQDSITRASATREDFFRLASFVHTLRTSDHRSLELAANEAASTVRKYYFDYSDFTAIEKTKFARIFPFYKWTRKAFPLMVETLFAQPGKALMYPKAMHALSESTGYDLSEKGGLYPGADAVVPEWINSKGLVPLYEHEGHTVYGGAAVPFTDVMGMGNAPMTTLFGMVNPAVTGAYELKFGEDTFTGAPVKADTNYAASLFPQGSFANAMRKKVQGGEVTGVGDALSDPRFLQFITGLTLAENTEKSMTGELEGRKQKINDLVRKEKKKTEPQ